MPAALLSSLVVCSFMCFFRAVEPRINLAHTGQGSGARPIPCFLWRCFLKTSLLRYGRCREQSLQEYFPSSNSSENWRIKSPTWFSCSSSICLFMLVLHQRGFAWKSQLLHNITPALAFWSASSLLSLNSALFASFLRVSSSLCSVCIWCFNTLYPCFWCFTSREKLHSEHWIVGRLSSTVFFFTFCLGCSTRMCFLILLSVVNLRSQKSHHL